MTRSFREITYTAPLAPPIECEAFLASDEGDWRVVVIPGTPCNKHLFTRFLRTAPRGIEVVVIGRPGFGPNHREAYTNWDDQIAAIRPFLPGGGFGDKKVVTLGVSYGGELALKAALDFPDKIAGVVTVAALIDEPHDYALTLEKFGGAEGVEDLVPDRWHKVRAEIAGRRDQIGPLLEQLATLEAPVEVLHGDFDAVVPKSNAEKLLQHLGPKTQAGYDLVPGGTHYLELQYPRRLYAAVQRVIERAQ